uniref:Caspase recruitment domain family member 14 n=1 Tax=Callorhinchus milii TaxID=7868 RepID=A0A4W3KGX4_CALMI
MDVVPPGKLVIKDLDEEAIWDLIENHRHIITSKVRPCHITPYLRQCLVITETDEEEILFGPHLKHRCMRTGYLLDLLRSRGKKGGVAFLESLGFYNPEIYTLITGEEPTRECSSMLGKIGLIFESKLPLLSPTPLFLVQEKCQKHQLHEKSQILEEQNQQLKKELESTKAMEANLSRMKMDWHRHHDEMFRLKEENYQILMRYTNTLQEKEMAVTRKAMSLDKDSQLVRKASQCKVTIDILEQDRVEALEDRQEMMKEMNTLRLDLDQADQLRNEFLDEKENLLMECTTLKMDCNMYKEKIDSLQSQVSELQKERDEAYGARDEVQVQMSKMIIDKDLCRRQVIELQDTCRELNKEILIFPPGIQRLRLLSRVSLVTFNGDSILDQIEIIGGNVTGIFIHNIKPESPALNSGLKTGFQIIMVEYNTQERKRTSLEDASLEEAVWTLKHIKGICSLSIRDNREVYQNLVENIEKKLVTSGDSFYIRANITFNKESGSLGGFTVQCNEILHITDSFFRRNSEWKAFRVNPHTMADMASGTIPNYYRKLVRIVSADISQRNPLWLSFDSDTINPDKDEGKSHFHSCFISDEQLPGNCFTLMPYSLVRPCHPPALRPVILVSTLIGKILSKKLLPFLFLECLRNEDYAEKERRGDIVGLKDIQNSLCSCFTRKAVEAVVAKNVHCLLELSLDCVRQLHRMEIYPIVIVIHMCEKNNKKLKKILHKYRVNEELLLKCAQREEGCLDKLPCLYHSIAPDAWNDLDSLINCVKTAVREEQKKIVWIEKAPL